MAEKKSSAKNIIAKLDQDDISSLVKKIMNSENKIGVILDLCNFAYVFCEKIKEKNYEVYKNNVEPKLIRLDHIKTKLQMPDLTEEQENKYLTDLICLEKEIKEEGKEYNQSTIEKLALVGGGVSIGITIGAVAVVILQRIFGKNRSTSI